MGGGASEPADPRGRHIGPSVAPLEAVALDGKTARGSFDGLEKAVHLLSLMAHESGLTLTQMAVPNGVEGKTNEHKTALRLLDGMTLDRTSSPVTPSSASATSRNRSSTPRGTTSGSSRRTNPPCCMTSRWPLPLPWKGHFPPRQQRSWAEAMASATTLDKGHGRCERRTLKATTALNDYLDWPGVAQVGQIASVVTRDGKTTREVRSFITAHRAARRMRGSCWSGGVATGRLRTVRTMYVT